MESSFSFSTLFNLVLTVIWFVSGICDFQGKDPLINLPFNQYNRDPEYRAFWQKKNGILFMFNGVMDLLSYLTSSSRLFGGFRLMGIAVAVDVVYLIAYYIWEHSAD